MKGGVVEGFFDCWKVHPAGQPSVVAWDELWLVRRDERLLRERIAGIVRMLDRGCGWAASQPPHLRSID
jgi:hypothetical protein